MQINREKIYLFTGKGGVGKTTLSQAFSKRLEKRKVPHTLFQLTSDKLLEYSTNKNKLTSKSIDFFEISSLYLLEKTKSKKLAHFIAHSQFYQSITGVLPNLKFLSLWYYLFSKLKKSGETIILDAPSSGHTLNALNAPAQFRDIFGSGIFYKDCQKVIEYFEKDLHLFYVSLPNQLNFNEMKDFDHEIEKIANISQSLIINQCYSSYIKKAQTPWLENRIKQESESLKSIKRNYSLFNIVPEINKQSLLEEISKKEFFHE